MMTVITPTARFSAFRGWLFGWYPDQAIAKEAWFVAAFGSICGGCADLPEEDFRPTQGRANA